MDFQSLAKEGCQSSRTQFFRPGLQFRGRSSRPVRELSNKSLKLASNRKSNRSTCNYWSTQSYCFTSPIIREPSYCQFLDIACYHSNLKIRNVNNGSTFNNYSIVHSMVKWSMIVCVLNRIVVDRN